MGSMEFTVVVEIVAVCDTVLEECVPPGVDPITNIPPKPEPVGVVADVSDAVLVTNVG